jgi:hypothetical protein
MAGDMIPLSTCCSAILPFASETKIVGAFPTNVSIAQVVV